MKNLALFIFVLLLCYQTEVFSQPCLAEDITFATQKEIDNFQTNYPGCTIIEGNVKMVTIFDNMCFSKNYDQMHESDHNKVSLIKFSPLGFIDYSLKTLWVAYEQQFKSNQSFLIELGYFYKNVRPGHRLNQKKLNFQLNTEYHYYLDKNLSNLAGWYLSPQLYYTQASYNTDHNICIECISSGWSNFFGSYECSTWETNYYQILRREMGFVVKAGHQFIIRKMFYIDVFGGLGMKAVFTHTQGKKEGINCCELFDKSFLDFPDWMSLDEDLNGLRPKVSLGFRLGIGF